MGLQSFLHSDIATQKKKLAKWWHRNDWNNAHKPSLGQRVRNEWQLLCTPDRYIVVSGWLLKFYDSKKKYMNWGDDINVYLFEKLSGKLIIPNDALLFRSAHKNYALIGSILPKSINGKSIVWGSGCQDFDQVVHRHPKQVLAVRGPKTRAYLLRNGIECPEVYGDPALLLPLVYQPKDKTLKYKMTFIPHHKDIDEPDKLNEVLLHYPDAHVINMTDYNNWTDVIDEICQSEMVFSSSLHGLIVSDAYGIPNAFCEFVHHHAKYDKFEDYFESVGRECPPPCQMQKHSRLNARKAA